MPSVLLKLHKSIQRLGVLPKTPQEKENAEGHSHEECACCGVVSLPEQPGGKAGYVLGPWRSNPLGLT